MYYCFYFKKACFHLYSFRQLHKILYNFDIKLNNGTIIKISLGEISQ